MKFEMTYGLRLKSEEQEQTLLPVTAIELKRLSVRQAAQLLAGSRPETVHCVQPLERL